MARPVDLKERAVSQFTLDVTNGVHHLYADEPENLGGADLGFSPFEYLEAALGSCTLITLRMYAKRKDLDVGNLSCKVSHTLRDGTHVFKRHIASDIALSEDIRADLLRIADKCPVHRMLEPGTILETGLA
jgi:putative redox protein